MMIRNFASALVLAATMATGAAQAADPAPAPTAALAKPSDKQLAALCAECAIVTAVKTERRRGKASGVGIAGGAVAGGVVGSKVGDSTVATVGGAVVGGVVGNEIEKRLKKRTVWVTTATLKNGTSQRFEADADPGLKAGDTVTVANGRVTKR